MTQEDLYNKLKEYFSNQDIIFEEDEFSYKLVFRIFKLPLNGKVYSNKSMDLIHFAVKDGNRLLYQNSFYDFDNVIIAVKKWMTLTIV